jgi:hypothetical protein
LRFLVWFAFDYLAKGNLPRLLVPDDLADILGAPFLPDGGLLTTGMSLRIEMRQPERRLDTMPTDQPAEIAASFDALSEVLSNGDPRLAPETVSRFWFGGTQPQHGLTRYEYVAARAFCHDLRPPVAWQDSAHADSSRLWFRERYLPRVPSAAIFSPSLALENGAADPPETEPAPNAVVVYRDQETICGLSRAAAATIEALKKCSLPVHDIHFNFARNNIEGEYARNQEQVWNADRVAHVVCMNPEHVPECLLSHLGRIAESDYIIGQFYWELSELGAAHECGLSLVNEIWVASEYLKQLYEERTHVPVIVMGQVVNAAPSPRNITREAFGLPLGGYSFFTAFDAASNIERKNPLGLARATSRKANPRGPRLPWRRCTPKSLSSISASPHKCDPSASRIP